MRSAAAPTSDVRVFTFGPTRRKYALGVAVTSGWSLEGSPYDLSRQGCRRSSVPRKTRWAAGRRMARTAFPPAPGSRHRGSVGARPRYGDTAACPPVPSGSPSLGTHGGARRPALYVGTSARLALAPCAPSARVSPMWGTTLRSSGANAIQRSTHTVGQPPDDRVRRLDNDARSIDDGVLAG